MKRFMAETVSVTFAPADGESETVDVRVASVVEGHEEQSLLDVSNAQRRGKLVLALPGLGCTYGTYDGLLHGEHLGDGDYSVVSFNLPGHGCEKERTSLFGHHPHTVENLAELAMALVKQTGLDKFDGTAIVGHSMSGPIALYLAELFSPDRLMGIFAIEPNLVSQDCRTTAAIAGQSLEEFRETGQLTVALDLRNFIGAGARQRAARFWWAQQFMETDPAVMHQASRSVVELCGGSLKQLILERIQKTPVFCPYSADLTKGSAKEFLPDGSMDRVPDTGHFLHMERPDQVYGLLAHFLRCAERVPPLANRYSSTEWLERFARARGAA